MKKNAVIGLIVIIIAIIGGYHFFQQETEEEIPLIKNPTEPEFVFNRVEYEQKHPRLGGSSVTLTVTNIGTTADIIVVQIIYHVGDMIIEDPDLYWEFENWDQDETYVMWGPESVGAYKEEDVIDIRVWYAYKDLETYKNTGYMEHIKNEVYLSYKLKKGDVTII